MDGIFIEKISQDKNFEVPEKPADFSCFLTFLQKKNVNS